MAVTYEPIATTTLGSDTASVTFSSISGTYTDLVLICNANLTAAATMKLQVNNDTGTNYSYTRVYGDGTGPASDRSSSVAYISIGFNNNMHNSITHLQNYSNATTNKTFITRWNSAAYVLAQAGLWRNTSAINRIDISATSGNLASGSTFTLYGIKAA